MRVDGLRRRTQRGGLDAPGRHQLFTGLAQAILPRGRRISATHGTPSGSGRGSLTGPTGWQVSVTGRRSSRRIGIPASAFPHIATRSPSARRRGNLIEGRRCVYEKPFGETRTDRDGVRPTACSQCDLRRHAAGRQPGVFYRIRRRRPARAFNALPKEDRRAAISRAHAVLRMPGSRIRSTTSSRTGRATLVSRPPVRDRGPGVAPATGRHCVSQTAGSVGREPRPRHTGTGIRTAPSPQASAPRGGSGI